MNPPPVGLPPGANVSSDVYAASGHAAPLPVSPARGREVPSWAKALVYAVVTVVCFVGGWYIAGFMFKGDKTYKSQDSALSFKYPYNWKRVEATSAEDFEAMIQSGGLAFNEIVLADSGDSDMKYVVAVGSGPSQDTATFAAAKQDFLTYYSSTIVPALSAGQAPSTPTVADTTVGGVPAWNVQFEATVNGQKATYTLTAVQGGENTFAFLFWVNTGQGGKVDQVNKILDSVKFKS